MTPHITETQLHDLLSATTDMAATPAHTHLAACTRCQEDFATLEQSIADFRLAATNLALLNPPPRPIVGTSIHRSFFAFPKLVWATGIASVIAVTVGTISVLHKPAPPAPTVTAASYTQPVSDEALLQDIDSDLSTSVPPSLQPLDTTTTASEPTPTSTSN